MDSYGIGSESHQVLTDGRADGGAGASVSAAADLFKAVAHPVRARVLELLSQGESSIPELCEGTGVKASHLSRHLMQMRGQHLIQCVRSGGHLVYRLEYPEAAELLTAARSVLHARTAAALGALHPVTEQLPTTALGDRQLSALEAAMSSRSIIGDACQAIVARNGCSPAAAAGHLIMSARTRSITLMEAAQHVLRDGPEAPGT